MKYSSKHSVSVLVLRWEWTWGLKILRRLAWQAPKKPSALLRLDFLYALFVNIKIYKKVDKISTENHRYINPVAISTKKKETQFSVLLLDLIFFSLILAELLYVP